MFDQIRRALSTVGGFQVVAAMFAIGWGLSKLAQVAEERQNACDDLAAELLEAQLSAAVARHPAASPTAEDLDPLGRAEVDDAPPAEQP